MSRPKATEPLLIYLGMADYAVSAALVLEEEGVQKPMYFVSHVLRGPETRYPPLEKMALALVIVSRKLRPYFQSHQIKVRTCVPLRKVLTDFEASGRLLKWALELSEYNISYHLRPALKSQVLADFIAEYSTPPITSKKWELFVDGSTTQNGAGVGVSMTGPRGERLNYSIQLLFSITNNAAKYEAMIAGLTLAKEVGAREVQLFSDSQLVVRQI